MLAGLHMVVLGGKLKAEVGKTVVSERIQHELDRQVVLSATTRAMRRRYIASALSVVGRHGLARQGCATGRT